MLKSLIMASENQKCSEETTIFVQTQTGSQINGFSWRKKKLKQGTFIGF